MSSTIRLKRGTRVDISNAAVKGDLLEGEPLFITDEARFAVATSTTTYQDFAKASEATGGGGATWGSIDGVLSNQTDLQVALNSKENTVTAGTISQYWRGDKSWRDFFTDVRAATLTGLSTATNAVISATDTVLSALGKLQAQISSHFGAGGTAHANATTSNSGFMSATDKVKLDSVEANAQVNVATNLSEGTRSTTSVNVNSSTGSSATLNSASVTQAGVMSSADKTKLDGIAAGATANTGTVTSVSGTGTVSGLTLNGTVTTSGNLTLGGTLAVTASDFASQSANTFLAAPNGSAGVPTFRGIVVADVPTLNQNTTGTASNVTGVVAVANGGTGSSTATGARSNLSAQETLVSGVNIKTINGTSVLGAGDIAISGGAGGTVTSVSATVPSFLTVTGVPITGSGTIAISYSGTALPIANGGTGATDAATARTNLVTPQRGAFATSPETSVRASDIRNLTNPTSGLGYASGVRFRFSALNDNSASPFADVIDLSTYVDSTGGGLNSLYFGKNSQIIQHKYATAGATSWTTKTLAYTDSSITGNAATATTAINLSTTRANWATNGVITAVVGELAWKNYSNNHTIFDASAGTAPNGTAISNTNSQVAWTGTYPTLMGWNGSNTYGVRVDSARLADSATSVSGTVLIANGGTSGTTATSGLVNLYRNSWAREANNGVMVAGGTYSIWTGGGAILMYLPNYSSAAVGDKIYVQNLHLTWASANFTVARQDAQTRIMLLGENLVCNMNVGSIVLTCVWKDGSFADWNVASGG